MHDARFCISLGAIQRACWGQTCGDTGLKLGVAVRPNDGNSATGVSACYGK